MPFKLKGAAQWDFDFTFGKRVAALERVLAVALGAVAVGSDVAEGDVEATLF